MMRGEFSSAPIPPRQDRRRYEVVRSGDGWCVAVNGCRTRPSRDRETVEQLARRLQFQSDRLDRLQHRTGRTH